jgi:hypothetical protein
MKPKPPATCGECPEFQNDFGDWGFEYGVTFCRLSNEVTYHYQNPLDRPVPRPTRCPWNPIKGR